MNSTWKEKYTQEVARAERARRENNEGMARVCARRAAGAVIQEYLHRQAVHLPRLSTVLIPGASALNHLKFFCDDPAMPAEARRVAAHFLLQLQPDHTLPGAPDLIADARWLAQTLLNA